MNRLDLRKKIPAICLIAVSAFAFGNQAYAAVDPLPTIISTNGATYSNPDVNTLKINVEQKVADVKFSKFDVGDSNEVIINFTGKNQALFGRVTSVGSSYSSIINGKLTQTGYNGSFYLINPNGILIGSNAKINVGSFMASTLNLTDSALNNFAATKKLALARTTTSLGGVWIDSGAQINVNSGVIVANGAGDSSIATIPNMNLITSDGVTFNVNSKNFVNLPPVAVNPYVGTKSLVILRSHAIPVTNTELPTPDPDPVVPEYDTTLLPVQQDMELIAPTPLKLVASTENHNHTGTNIAVFPIGQTSLTGSINGDQTPGLIALNNTTTPALAPGMEVALNELTPVGAAGRIQNVGNASKENFDMVIDEAILPE